MKSASLLVLFICHNNYAGRRLVVGYTDGNGVAAYTHLCAYELVIGVEL